MGRTSQKDMDKARYKNNDKKRKLKNIFPHCIGTFPECSNYTPDTPESDRKECKCCPYKGKKSKTRDSIKNKIKKLKSL